jgi:DNA invertase Pin-like site-specific DNA recombinase
MQEEKIRAYCALYELDLVGLWSDPGQSGKNLDRPGIRYVLAELRDGRADGMIISKLDRLSRSIRDWASLIEELFAEKGGARLFSVNDSIDTRSASGRLVLNVLMSVSQWEREIIGERTSDTLQGKIARGERCGRLRFGYDLAADGKTLVPNLTELEAIRILSEARQTGATFRDLCRLADEHGIKTKEGRPWQPATIRRILERA